MLTIEVLERLRKEFPSRPMTVLWDGASYHRSAIVLAAAARLGIEIVRLPAYSPDFMPVEARAETCGFQDRSGLAASDTVPMDPLHAICQHLWRRRRQQHIGTVQ